MDYETAVATIKLAGSLQRQKKEITRELGVQIVNACAEHGEDMAQVLRDEIDFRSHNVSTLPGNS